MKGHSNMNKSKTKVGGSNLVMGQCCNMTNTEDNHYRNASYGTSGAGRDSVFRKHTGGTPHNSGSGYGTSQGGGMGKTSGNYA